MLGAKHVMNIGLLHPGAMGATIGAAMVPNAEAVMWLPAGRSDASRERAIRAGLTAADRLKSLCLNCEAIVSVCPPHAATTCAEDVINSKFTGIYVEANAISPEKTLSIQNRLQSAGINMVDGGIIGGPAWPGKNNPEADPRSLTQLYLSGYEATKICRLFEDSEFATTCLSEAVGDASALKMAFAAYTKGSTALLTAIVSVAEYYGVRNALENQWGETMTQRTHQQLITNSSKAWRFSGEMREIANTFKTAGNSDGFHLAAADTFDKLSDHKDWQQAPSLNEILESLKKN